jgi:D-alanine-D-alanine ligase
MKILILDAKEERPRLDNEAVLKCVKSVEAALWKAGHTPCSLFVSLEQLSDPAGLTRTINGIAPECIFNLFEGFSFDAGQEVVMASFLATLGLPFTGNRSVALKACLDKAEVGAVLRTNGVRVPGSVRVSSTGDIDPAQVSYPVFVKPCREDGSFGIDKKSLCHNKEELVASLEAKLAVHVHGVVVEDFIPGREFNASFVGKGPYEMFAASVMDYSLFPELEQFFSYDSKWKKDAPEYKVLVPRVMRREDPDFPPELEEMCLKIGGILGLRGYFRVDFREKNGQLYVLDVNPNPDISPDAGLARQALSVGYTYEKMIERIVKEAMDA